MSECLYAAHGADHVVRGEAADSWLPQCRLHDESTIAKIASGFGRC